jgi:hypothetical protein
LTDLVKTHMNKKILGIFLVLLGGYLVIGNTILSILFTYVGPIGYDGQINLVSYLANWFSLYGLITILIAIIGIFSIKYGISNLKRDQIKIS